jgi:hypothetical protein
MTQPKAAMEETWILLHERPEGGPDTHRAPAP